MSETEWTQPLEIEETADPNYVEPVAASAPETEAGTEAVIYEDLSGADPEATEEIVIVEVIETVGSDLVHANLFGSFLLCGTMIGLFLLRGIHGT